MRWRLVLGDRISLEIRDFQNLGSVLRVVGNRTVFLSSP
jgi:hypothetical protein